MVCFLKENILALVHSPPLCPFASDLQDPSLNDTPVDSQWDMEFLIKILLPSKISLPLNKLIKKIFLPHINSIAAQPSPAHEN